MRATCRLVMVVTPLLVCSAMPWSDCRAQAGSSSLVVQSARVAFAPPAWSLSREPPWANAAAPTGALASLHWPSRRRTFLVVEGAVGGWLAGKLFTFLTCGVIAEFGGASGSVADHCGNWAAIAGLVIGAVVGAVMPLPRDERDGAM